MQTSHAPQSEVKKAAFGGLAVVGFIVLILLGIFMAIYAASAVPKLLSRISQTASVYFSSDFTPSGDTTLEPVTPSPTPTEPVVETPTTLPVPALPQAPVVTPPQTGGPRYTPAQPTYTVVQVPTTQNLYGDPDLTIEITEVGYLRTNSTSSFVRSSHVPDGKRGAVKFVVTNRGTNKADSGWRFEAELPTSPSYTYRSSGQRALNPGDEIEFIVGFDNGRVGNNREITVTVDSEDDIDESNERNNDDSADIDIDD